MFHGRGGNSNDIEAATKLSQFSDQNDIVVAYPQGLQAPDGSGSFWSTRGTSRVDDVAFTAGIIDRLERDLCLDAKRIYAAGFSNGGGFVMTIACRLANRVAAVLSIAGYFFEPTGGCHPQRPISILEVHGAADDNVVYGGIPAGDDEPELLAVPVWLEQWARLDHCHSNPTVFMQTAQLTAERWSGCAARAEIEHYKLENFGHAIPTMLSARPFNAVAWSFLNRHRLE